VLAELSHREQEILRTLDKVYKIKESMKPRHVVTNSSSPGLERLTQERKRATVDVRIADGIIRQARSNMEHFQRDRAVAQGKLDLTTEQWELRKQLDEANKRSSSFERGPRKP
jgi:hypothetical protein